jgi:diacylglycerol kinase (ATP)
MVNFGKRLESFTFALAGLRHVLKTQHNMRIHFAITIAVVLAGFILHVKASDWCWLIIAITFVLFSEILNTAVEYLCDVVQPEHHASVQNAKDISAAAVLVAATGAAIIGALVFWPYFGS